MQTHLRVPLWIIVLFLGVLLAGCAAQPTTAPSATVILPPTRTQPIPPDTLTPIPPTVTPLPTETLVPSETPTCTPSPTITPIPLPEPILDSQGVLMAYIPAGTFEMGNKDGYDDVLPVHTVNLPQAFYMDVYEVTNASYAACVAAGDCSAPFESSSYTRDEYYNNPDFANYPVIYVNWEQANDYCTWRGARLPTEAEWEYAARGGLEGKSYPWGDKKPVRTAGAVNGANFGGTWLSGDDTVSVGSYAPNGYGLYDMAGNVWEWVSDWYSADYYDSSPRTSPTGPANGERRVVRGGSWQHGASYLTVSYRVSNDPLSGFGTLTGFRCVAPIDMQVEVTP